MRPGVSDFVSQLGVACFDGSVDLSEAVGISRGTSEAFVALPEFEFMGCS